MTTGLLGATARNDRQLALRFCLDSTCCCCCWCCCCCCWGVQLHWNRRHKESPEGVAWQREMFEVGDGKTHGAATAAAAAAIVAVDAEDEAKSNISTYRERGRERETDIERQRQRMRETETQRETVKQRLRKKKGRDDIRETGSIGDRNLDSQGQQRPILEIKYVFMIVIW